MAAGVAPAQRLAPSVPVLKAFNADSYEYLPAAPGAQVSEAELFPEPDGRAPSLDAMIRVVAVNDDPGAADSYHPRAVRVNPRPTWTELADLSVQSAAPQHFDPIAMPPIDEAMVNPIGFRPKWTRGIVQARANPNRAGSLLLDGDGWARTVDLRVGPSEADITKMRAVQGVEVDWSGGPGPYQYVRFVAALAMAGIPLAQTRVPSWAHGLLSKEFIAEFENAADLSAPLNREERSVRLRRIALRDHSIAGWKMAIGSREGLRTQRQKCVSVLLVTRRPDMVPFALRQIDRQTVDDLEICLVTHGFSLTEREQKELLEGRIHRITVRSAPEGATFGEALNMAADGASGDVLLKMDDDDWYGSDFVQDLRDAYHYSGATLVGTAARFVFLHDLWCTVMRSHIPECFTTHVAGATLMLDQADFKAVGGYQPLPRSVDAGLLDDIQRAGGRIYRTHGLNFMVRRAGSGHTWSKSMSFFLRNAGVAAQWHGFNPSTELDVTQEALPVRLRAEAQ